MRFEPTPLRTGTWRQSLRLLGQTVDAQGIGLNRPMTTISVRELSSQWHTWNKHVANTYPSSVETTTPLPINNTYIPTCSSPLSMLCSVMNGACSLASEFGVPVSMDTHDGVDRASRESEREWQREKERERERGGERERERERKREREIIIITTDQELRSIGCTYYLLLFFGGS